MQSYRGVVCCKHIDFTIESYGRINHLIILDDARSKRSDTIKRSALRSFFYGLRNQSKNSLEDLKKLGDDRKVSYNRCVLTIIHLCTLYPLQNLISRNRSTLFEKVEAKRSMFPIEKRGMSAVL